MPTEPSSPGGKQSPKADEKSKADNTTSQDDLPEREPLTPELVEDEAIRGDFMMRWALVLLALMFGVTDILETETLVHIKSGQYTLQNGLPARTGIFSSTASDRSWANLSWLFDVILAGFYQLGETVGITGGIVLSIVKGLIAATVFGILVHISRKNLSTWWGTICAAITLLVCYRQFTAKPELITLLGLVLTLSFLMRWRENDSTKLLKSLVVLFFVWSNLDPGMFFGLAILLFYAIGETAGQWLGFSGLPNAAMRKRLWITVGVCFAVTLLNPFGWNPLLVPYVRYAIEYPALKTIYPNAVEFSRLQFYGLAEPRFWDHLDSEGVAGLILLATALITFGLNFRRLDLGDVLVWLAFSIFALLASHELAAAAVVSAVLATVNAQEWYRHAFRQSYSVDTSELVFSRGGRAITVVAMFGMAYLGVSGRLDRRTGVGFDPHLQGAIEAMRNETKDSFDDRPFNFVPEQGDLLIWVDKKPFLDSRVVLYHGTGNDDLIGLHLRTRSALRKADQPGPDGRKWKEGLDRFDITHVIPRLDSRLTESKADFITFMKLAASPDWTVTRFGAGGAVFYRTDLNNPKLTTYLNKNSVDLADLAFHPRSDPPDVRPAWAVPRSAYENLLFQPRDNKPNSVALAENCITLAGELMSSKVPMPEFYRSLNATPESVVMCLVHAAVRHANIGISENPNSATAFRVLGQSYFYLMQFESPHVRTVRRDRQALAALHQALALSPRDFPSLSTLGHLHSQQGRYDLAAETWKKCLEILDSKDSPLADKDETRKAITVYQRRSSDLVNQRILELEKRGLRKLSDDEQSRKNRIQLIDISMKAGLVLTAITLFEDDPDLIKADPQFLVTYIELLQMAGRFEDADANLQGMQFDKDQFRQNVPLQNLTALNSLIHADFLEAGKTWESLAGLFDQNRLQSMFEFIPLTVRSPESFRSVLARNSLGNRVWPENWAADQLASLSNTDRIAGVVALFLLEAGLSELEAGRTKKAVSLFRRIIETASESPAANLAGRYLRLINHESWQPPAQPRPPDVGKQPGQNSNVPAKTSKKAG